MVAYEYANALIELSLSNNVLNEIEDNFKTLVLAIKENPDFMKVITYPLIKTKDKKKSIKDVCNNMNELFVNFLYVLIDNNRINDLFVIYKEFCKIIDQNNNRLTVDVISAVKLSKNEIDNLSIKLSAYFNNKKININPLIDKTLIGGIKVISDGKSIDLSVIGKLNNLKEQI